MSHRSIIAIDLDYFYAQAEEVNDPSLKDKPLAIVQKQIVVTCNYVARAAGVTKLELLTTAIRKCPSLVLINGEDITRYRRISKAIFSFVDCLFNKGTSSKSPVQRLGLDELFIDVSQLIDNHLQTSGSFTLASENVYFSIPGGSTVSEDLKAGGASSCLNWCEGFTYVPYTVSGTLITPVSFIDRHLYAKNSFKSSEITHHTKSLMVASHIAEYLRKCIKEILGYTCSAGVAHNKMLAKLGTSVSKPNGQSIFIPQMCLYDSISEADVVLAYMKDVELRRIPGFGTKIIHILTEKMNSHEIEKWCFNTQTNDTELADSGVTSRELSRLFVKDILSRCTEEQFVDWLGQKQGTQLHDLCLGIDNSQVLPEKHPSQISVEDSFQSCTTILEAENRMHNLIILLLERLEEEELSDIEGGTPLWAKHALVCWKASEIAPGWELNTSRKGKETLRNVRSATLSSSVRISNQWKRHARTIRLTIRQNGLSRESRSSAIPTEFFNVNITHSSRASMLVEATLRPLLKKMLVKSHTLLSIQSKSKRPRTSSKSRDIPQAPPFNITLINICATNFFPGNPEQSLFTLAQQDTISNIAGTQNVATFLNERYFTKSEHFGLTNLRARQVKNDKPEVVESLADYQLNKSFGLEVPDEVDQSRRRMKQYCQICQVSVVSWAFQSHMRFHA
ncbi:hypothetical protein BJ742DRAFT_277740 [Cladochytrium replicatum]|nr:hypothetical protein BJ742DRAFT_277740 [Cladochytrium replicatum]